MEKDAGLSSVTSSDRLSDTHVVGCVFGSLTGVSQLHRNHPLVDQEGLLPKYFDTDAKVVLSAVGMVFEGEFEENPNFVRVRLPPGWKKFLTPPGRGASELFLVDAKDRRRAKIRLGPHDEDCLVSVLRRFHIHSYMETGKLSDTYFCEVVDSARGDTVIFRTEKARVKLGQVSVLNGRNPTFDMASAWLTEHYPEWMSPLAYWD